jgi:hypothetical protein
LDSRQSKVHLPEGGDLLEGSAARREHGEQSETPHRFSLSESISGS